MSILRCPIILVPQSDFKSDVSSKKFHCQSPDTGKEFGPKLLSLFCFFKYHFKRWFTASVIRVHGVLCRCFLSQTGRILALVPYLLLYRHIFFLASLCSMRLLLSRGDVEGWGGGLRERSTCFASLRTVTKVHRTHINAGWFWWPSCNSNIERWRRGIPWGKLVS